MAYLIYDLRHIRGSYGIGAKCPKPEVYVVYNMCGCEPTFNPESSLGNSCGPEYNGTIHLSVSFERRGAVASQELGKIDPVFSVSWQTDNIARRPRHDFSRRSRQKVRNPHFRGANRGRPAPSVIEYLVLLLSALATEALELGCHITKSVWHRDLTLSHSASAAPSNDLNTDRTEPCTWIAIASGCVQVA